MMLMLRAVRVKLTSMMVLSVSREWPRGCEWLKDSTLSSVCGRKVGDVSEESASVLSWLAVVARKEVCS